MTWEWDSTINYLSPDWPSLPSIPAQAILNNTIDLTQTFLSQSVLARTLFKAALKAFEEKQEEDKKKLNSATNDWASIRIDTQAPPLLFIHGHWRRPCHLSSRAAVLPSSPLFHLRCTEEGGGGGKGEGGGGGGSKRKYGLEVGGETEVFKLRQTGAMKKQGGGWECEELGYKATWQSNRDLGDENPERDKRREEVLRRGVKRREHMTRNLHQGPSRAPHVTNLCVKELGRACIWAACKIDGCASARLFHVAR